MQAYRKDTAHRILHPDPGSREPRGPKVGPAG
ncbi:MAG: hypothetical protein HW375_1759, partial [Anaerolineales bacterium]|nr:hypothetical protein [Anaerolineales bacterium]